MTSAGFRPEGRENVVIDTSALAAIVFGEADRGSMIQAIVSDQIRLISSATLVEAGIVVEARYGEPGGRQLDLLLQRAGFQEVPHDRRHAEIARAAWRRFGRGRHEAALNLGDCFSYALARATGEPLLFKGDDFALTDVTPAL